MIRALLLKSEMKPTASLVWGCGGGGSGRGQQRDVGFIVGWCEERWWKARRRPPREHRRRPAFRDQIERYREHAVTCLENLRSSVGFINVAYDLSLRFGFVDRSTFYYNQNVGIYFT